MDITAITRGGFGVGDPPGKWNAPGRVMAFHDFKRQRRYFVTRVKEDRDTAIEEVVWMQMAVDGIDLCRQANSQVRTLSDKALWWKFTSRC